MIVQDKEGNKIKIEVLMTFKIPEINKNYVVYSINDDGISETVTILINELVYENNLPKIVPIPKEETQMVLAFYTTIRNNI
jgi:uncharacterized protein YrzB (UPF0473 family)